MISRVLIFTLWKTQQNEAVLPEGDSDGTVVVIVAPPIASLSSKGRDCW